MKPESRADQIVKSILERPPEDRQSYLEDVCGSDENLRTEVLTILDSETHLRGYTTNPPEPESPVVAPLNPGDFVGPYRIIKVLGRGGMGDVYLAEHTGQNREVALKILPDSFLSDPQRVQRFRQEARTRPIPSASARSIPSCGESDRARR